MGYDLGPGAFTIDTLLQSASALGSLSATPSDAALMLAKLGLI